MHTARVRPLTPVLTQVFPSMRSRPLHDAPGEGQLVHAPPRSVFSRRIAIPSRRIAVERQLARRLHPRLPSPWSPSRSGPGGGREASETGRAAAPVPLPAGRARHPTDRGVDRTPRRVTDGHPRPELHLVDGGDRGPPPRPAPASPSQKPIASVHPGMGRGPPTAPPVLVVGTGQEADASRTRAPVTVRARAPPSPSATVSLAAPGPPMDAPTCPFLF